MLTLFLRAILMYLFVFLILRLTGKRQVSDLQPFDLLITLLIADLAGACIADTDTPLVYSVVPILGMYLVQQLIAQISLKSAGARRIICGSPVILVADGVVQESAMRDTHYTLIDLLDQLRSKDVFDLNEVAYAILETNGSMSVLQKSRFQAPNRGELRLPEEESRLNYLLVMDGALCRDAMAHFHLGDAEVRALVANMAACDVRDVFFLHRGGDGALHLQKKQRAGGGCVDREAGYV